MHKNTAWQEADFKWMARAIELAKQGKSKVYPNPRVGAVIVKGECLLGEGYHKAYGGAHAEIEALLNCGPQLPSGATLYVTLEPCCHFGKTPPCTAAILKAGIQRVVIGAVDSNPLVSGKGIELLRQSGIQVEVGLLARGCHEINSAFHHYIAFQRPYIILKAAMSLDGKIATQSGESQWITGEAARTAGHQTRGDVRGILVGIGTVLADDPLLNCRLEADTQAQPIRIILDKGLEIPYQSKLVQTARTLPLWVVTTTEQLNQEKAKVLTQLGVKLIEVPLSNGHFDWSVLLKILSMAGIDRLLIEGGGRVHDSALRAGVVDEVQVYIAPLIIGGHNAPSAVSGVGFNHLFEAVRLTEVSVTPCGQDWLYKAKVTSVTQVISREVGN